LEYKIGNISKSDFKSLKLKLTQLLAWVLYLYPLRGGPKPFVPTMILVGTRLSNRHLLAPEDRPPGRKPFAHPKGFLLPGDQMI
jgi:hypothetical protein